MTKKTNRKINAIKELNRLTALHSVCELEAGMEQTDTQTENDV